LEKLHHTPTKFVQPPQLPKASVTPKKEPNLKF